MDVHSAGMLIITYYLITKRGRTFHPKPRRKAGVMINYIAVTVKRPCREGERNHNYWNGAVESDKANSHEPYL